MHQGHHLKVKYFSKRRFTCNKLM